MLLSSPGNLKLIFWRWDLISHVPSVLGLQAHASSLTPPPLSFGRQVSHLSWLEKKTATALFESPLSATVQDALQSFLKV